MRVNEGVDERGRRSRSDVPMSPLEVDGKLRGDCGVLTCVFGVFGSRVPCGAGVCISTARFFSPARAATPLACPPV